MHPRILILRVALAVLGLGPWVPSTTDALSASTTTPPVVSHRGGARLFLDTADVTAWEELLPTGIFHGITTNPTLLERADEACTVANLHALADRALGYECCGEFMCQAWGKDLVECGRALAAPDPARIVVKVPVTPAGTAAAAVLARDFGIRVCLTACYHPKQALVAASVGAEYVAPYLGRMTDAGRDGLEDCVAMQRIVDGMGSTTRILVASLRDADTLTTLAAAGLGTATINPDVARALWDEPLTTAAAEAFEAAAAASASASAAAAR